eukprot:1554385-Rhodomonas_salina.1
MHAPSVGHDPLTSEALEVDQYGTVAAAVSQLELGAGATASTDPAAVVGPTLLVRVTVKLRTALACTGPTSSTVSCPAALSHRAYGASANGSPLKERGTTGAIVWMSCSLVTFTTAPAPRSWLVCHHTEMHTSPPGSVPTLDAVRSSSVTPGYVKPSNARVVRRMGLMLTDASMAKSKPLFESSVTVEPAVSKE